MIKLFLQLLLVLGFTSVTPQNSCVERLQQLIFSTDPCRSVSNHLSTSHWRLVPLPPIQTLPKVIAQLPLPSSKAEQNNLSAVLPSIVLLGSLGFGAIVYILYRGHQLLRANQELSQQLNQLRENQNNRIEQLVRDRIQTLITSQDVKRQLQKYVEQLEADLGDRFEGMVGDRLDVLIKSSITQQIKTHIGQLQANLNSRIDQMVRDLLQELLTNQEISGRFQEHIDRRVDDQLKQLLSNRLDETGTSSFSTIIPPDDSYQSVLDLYKRDPIALEAEAIKVAESRESFSRRYLDSSQPAILENKDKGNWWIVQRGSVHWLLPKPSLKVNTHIYEDILSLLFISEGYQEGENNQIQLIFPAVVESSDGQWLLKQPGKVLFGGHAQQSELTVETRIKKLESQLMYYQLAVKSNIDAIQKLSETLENGFQQAFVRLHLLEQNDQELREIQQNRVKQLVDLQAFEEYQVNLEREIQLIQDSLSELKRDRIDQEYKDLVENYETNSDKLADFQVIKIKMDDLEIKNIFGTEFYERGNYWLFPTQKDNYWLVPKRNWKINSHLKDEIEKFFTCKDLRDGYSSFQLKRPASLLPEDKLQKKWRLQEKGVLVFFKD